MSSGRLSAGVWRVYAGGRGLYGVGDSAGGLLVVAELFVEPVVHHSEPVHQLFLQNQLTIYQIGLIRLLVSWFVAQPMGTLFEGEWGGCKGRKMLCEGH